MTNMSIQPLWLTHFIEILLVLELQLTKFIIGTFSYKAHFRPQISSNGSNWHDRFIKKKVFCEGDWELLYDSRFKRDFKGKFCTRWLGPYQIYRVFDNGTVYLVTIDEKLTPLFVNGHRLRLYHMPILRDAFIS